MALIAPDELPVLRPASDVADVAANAKLDAEKMALAKLINSTANTGEYTALYNNQISDEAIAALESEGYTVTQRSPVRTADPKFQYIISWKP